MSFKKIDGLWLAVSFFSLSQNQSESDPNNIITHIIDIIVCGVDIVSHEKQNNILCTFKVIVQP